MRSVVLVLRYVRIGYFESVTRNNTPALCAEPVQAVSTAGITVPSGPGHCGHDQILFYRYSAGALAGPNGRQAGYRKRLVFISLKTLPGSGELKWHTNEQVQ